MYKSFNYNNEKEALEDINLISYIRDSRDKTAALLRGGRNNKYGKVMADYNTEIKYITSLYEKAKSDLEAERLKELELWKSNKSNSFKFEIEKKYKLLGLQIDQEYEKAILIIKDKLEFDKKNASIKDKIKYYGGQILGGGPLNDNTMTNMYMIDMYKTRY
jgi:hypothetical protein